MKRWIWMLLLALLLCPAGAWAQDLCRLAADGYPAYTMLQDEQGGGKVCLVMRRPDGREVVIGGVRDENTGVLVTHESAPIPEALHAQLEYAQENDSFTLALIDENGTRADACSLKPYGQIWGVTMGHFALGNFWAFSDRAPNGAWCFGSHPWSDIARIDWTTLPKTQKETFDALDARGWATPNSPNYNDRVHLRAAPRNDAVSLGKYYNGTPLRVLGSEGEWTHVSVFGVEGYMMTSYLAFGQDVESADNGLTCVGLASGSAEIYEWPEREAEHTTIREDTDVLILAVVGDDWYHIWSRETGESGYLPVEDVELGNG